MVVKPQQFEVCVSVDSMSVVGNPPINMYIKGCDPSATYAQIAVGNVPATEFVL